jgi:hypothetical protein
MLNSNEGPNVAVRITQEVADALDYAELPGLTPMP